MGKDEGKDRTKSIGGSDIATICGLSPYAKPIDVYMAKLGLKEVEENRFMVAGKKLEGVIADWFAEKTGKKLSSPQPTIYHPKYPWWSGTPDRLVVGEKAGVEIKNVGERMGKQWGETGTDKIPEYLYTQAVWYMPLTGFPKWYFAILIGGNDFRHYEIERNIKLENKLKEIAERFWFDHVLKKVPPAVDGTESYSNYLKTIYPAHMFADLIPATNEHRETARSLFAIKQTLMVAEESERFYENKLKEAIKDKEGILGGDFKVTWKKSVDGEKTDWKGLAKSLNPAQSQIKEFTETAQGSRRFLTNFKEWGDE